MLKSTYNVKIRRNLLCRDPEEDHAEAVDQEDLVAAEVARVEDSEVQEVLEVREDITEEQEALDFIIDPMDTVMDMVQEDVWAVCSECSCFRYL